MTMLRAIAQYPGAANIQNAEYTCTHGITPGLATIVCNVAGQQIAPVGTLVMSDGVRTVAIPHCRVEAGGISTSTNGQTLTVRLFDRRWMWRYGEISGHWNVPVPRIADVPAVGLPNQQQGNQAVADFGEDLPPIQQETKKSARRLCEMCLEAMGEKRFDVSAIPNDDWPEVDWDAANPAQELQALADRYGCRVVYRPDLDAVWLTRTGQGNPLPDPPAGLTASDNAGVDPPELPGRIVVYGSPISYQIRFSLEAVGLDFDGQVKKLNDLSYKPVGGWKTRGPGSLFVGPNDFAKPLPGARTYHDANALATQTVYRWYRIKNTLPAQGDDEFWVPVQSRNYIDKFKRDGIVLLSHRVETAVDDLDQRVKLPATCYGVTLRGSLLYTATNAGEEVKAPFSIDAARQIIAFTAPQFLTYTDGGSRRYKPAELILETACHVVERATNKIRRYRYEYSVSGPQKGKRPVNDALVIVREDIQHHVRVTYVDAIDNQVDTTVSNKPACDKQARYYAEAELAKLQTKTPQTRVYNCVMPVFPDGAIQSVSWSVGLDGVSTQASRDSELSIVAVPYAVRRRAEMEILRQQYENRGHIRPQVIKPVKAAKDFLVNGEG